MTFFHFDVKYTLTLGFGEKMKEKDNRFRAVIDIGSHSTRLLIAQVIRKGVYKQIEKLWIPIQIGKDTFSQGFVTTQTISEVIRVIRNFQEVLASYQVTEFTATATSSIRDASNSDVLIERIFSATGIRVEVVEPIKVIELLYENIAKILKDRYGFQKEKILILSHGAGSTQLALQCNGLIQFTETHNQGTLRLLKAFHLPEKYFEYIINPLMVSFQQTLKRFPELSNVQRFIAINDDLSQLMKLMKRDADDSEALRIDKEEFNEMLGEFQRLSGDQIKEYFGINESFVDTTRVAFLMMSKFLDYTNAKEIILMDINLSGSMMSRMSHTDEYEQVENEHFFDPHIISAAIQLGRKYHFDEAHSMCVRDLALSFFDQMEGSYTFTPRERLYLDAAAILHDIGIFISPANHHKNSEILINESEILGLGQHELKIIGQIARYHRKSLPKASHIEYMALPMEHRVLVSRIASILKIADGLDHMHNQVVERIEIHLSEKKCELMAKMRKGKMEYFEILKYEVKRKSDLFESFFGVPVSLHQIL